MDEMNNNGIEITKACYYSGINRITYYYRRKHENNEDRRSSARTDNCIINKIIELCKERITYGYNRIWALLRNSGINIARKTVYKIMKIWHDRGHGADAYKSAGAQKTSMHRYSTVRIRRKNNIARNRESG